MSYHLWRFLLENDVDSFRQYLANATYTSTAPKQASGLAGGYSPKIGSPGVLATSPKYQTKSRKSSGNVHTQAASSRGDGRVLTRGDINSKDTFGRTLLHHATSDPGEEGIAFVKALLELPYVDLYAQDTESGWTPLHRALYFGNIASAQALMQRDVQDATDYTTTASHTHAGGLVKIKDNEGNSPFEVFGLTIAPRDIPTAGNLLSGLRDDDSSNSVDLNEDSFDTDKSKILVKPNVDVQGDEVFAFGSNKNLTLGTGDEDDRQFPERLHFVRPDHLLMHLHEEHITVRKRAVPAEDFAPQFVSPNAVGDVPALIRNKAIVIQEVVMSKLHTAVLTTDPISNLYTCGFGPGGRLGMGDETTSFNYRCVQSGGLAKRRVATIALGQDHSIAICSQGEVFTWGSNRYGQLGYALPEVSAKEVPTQLIPRQVYGLVKKELFIGAAASSIHSVIYTSFSMYTFGKNEGQLGLMDADARSLEIQTIPRRVAPSVLQSSIVSVSAIDRATIVLLETHEVFVFTHYGWTRIAFELEGALGSFLSDTMKTRYDTEGNYISKVTCGGNTVCAMSAYGEVFTVDVPKIAEAISSNASTTNPTRARNALVTPTRVWSIRKSHMSAIDVAVGQDGSVILCTSSGSVWRKERRANIKTVRVKDGPTPKLKPYKFVRVPNLTRAIAVRSNAYGAFTAIRKDTEVTREQVLIEPASLWTDIFPLLSFSKYGQVHEDESSDTPQLRFWQPATKGPSAAQVKRAVMLHKEAEADMFKICQRFEPLTGSPYDAWVTSNVTDVRIPVHAFVLKARSRVMRAALTEFQEAYYFSVPDVMAIEYGQDGQIHINFQGADFLTIANLVLYLYTDELIDVWHFISKALQYAARYRSVRTELMKIASNLELRQLERAVRLMIDPVKSLCQDMEIAVTDSDLFLDADVVIDLAGEDERLAHSVLLCARCPFFEGLFHGRAGGIWMTSRRGAAEENADLPRVDLKHVEARVFDLVLRNIYADTGQELFDDVVTKDFDEFAELVLEVMSVANELMIDRLAQICQSILGRFVNLKNVCRLLNAVADCSVNEFKQAAFEYICLNLESMLEQRLLDELDPDLFSELDEVVQANQLAFLPFARSNRAHEELLDHHPELAERIELSRKRRIDSMRLRTRLVEDEQREVNYHKFRVGSYDDSGIPGIGRAQRSRSSRGSSPGQSPQITSNDHGDDFPFEMDEDSALRRESKLPGLPSPSLLPSRADAQRQPLRSPSGTPEASRSLSRAAEELYSGSPSDAFLSSNPPTPAMTVTGFSAPTTPWQSSPQATRTIGLKDIMDETSSTRVSNLTQSLKKVDVASRTTPKVSQKERKRQIQRQKTEDHREEPLPPQAVTQSPATAQSPWQNMKQQRTPSTTFKTSEQKHGQASNSEAKNTDRAQEKVVGSPSPRIPQPVRTRSSPNITPTAKVAPPIIQSIRHTPTANRTLSDIDARTSMADILSQQLGEKTAVKEAVAKRSMQEIQQEQEFQEWWDKEIQRVQDEEAQASTSRSKRGKSGRGRGRQRGGGRGVANQGGWKDQAALQAKDDQEAEEGVEVIETVAGPGSFAIEATIAHTTNAHVN